MTTKINNKISYFLTSAIFSSAKTCGYALFMPTAIRKYLNKEDSYQSHIKDLKNRIKDTGNDSSLEKYVNIGDLAGYSAGLVASALYGIGTAYQLNNGELDMLSIWVATNGLSFGWEIGRKQIKK